MARAIQGLPGHLHQSLTSDGIKPRVTPPRLSFAHRLEIFFCDPASPWVRGNHENINGMLRQYFPHGTALSGHSQEHLDLVAAELDGRPREALGFRTPAEALSELLSAQLS
jgi:IS30 family transposase